MSVCLHQVRHIVLGAGSCSLRTTATWRLHVYPIRISSFTVFKDQFVVGRGIREGDSSSGGGGDDVPRHTTATGDSKPWHCYGPMWVLAALGLSLLLVSALDAADCADTSRASVSFIVPALNEAACIGDTVSYLRRNLTECPLEVIVVDGGSLDRTREEARRAGAMVVEGPRGRAKQLNVGASLAQGELLVFVHADSRPPRDVIRVVRKTLSHRQTVLGGFRTVIKHDGRVLGFMTWHHFVKTYYLPLLVRPLTFLRRCLFGDQTMFCRAVDFRRVGGFDEKLPIMEDLLLCIDLHMAGPAGSSSRQASPASGGTVRGPVLAGQSSSGRETAGRGSGGKPVWKWWKRRGRVKMVLWPAAETSGRRLAAWGDAHATLVHFRIGLGWYLGASAKEMQDLYHRLYTDAYR